MSAGDANSARFMVDRAQALAALLPRTLRIGEREVSGAWTGQALPKERGGATSQDEAELLGPGGVRLWLYRLVLGPGKPPRIHMQAQFPDAGDYYTYHDPRFERSFGAWRDDAAIAREMAQRLLPDYLAYFAVVARRKEVGCAIADRRYDDLALVGQVLTADLPDLPPSARVPRVRNRVSIYYSIERPDGLEVTAESPEIGAVTLKLSGLSVEDALDLLEYAIAQRRSARDGG